MTHIRVLPSHGRSCMACRPKLLSLVCIYSLFHVLFSFFRFYCCTRRQKVLHVLCKSSRHTICMQWNFGVVLWCETTLVTWSKQKPCLPSHPSAKLNLIGQIIYEWRPLIFEVEWSKNNLANRGYPEGMQTSEHRQRWGLNHKQSTGGGLQHSHHDTTPKFHCIQIVCFLLLLHSCIVT